MSILENRDWVGQQIDKRVLERCVKVCELGEVRSWKPEGDAGSGPVEVVLVNLVLAEAAKSVDGDPINPGFPVTARISVWADRPAEAQATIKELAVAALGLDRRAKQEEVDKAFTDWSSLKGKKVSVTFDTRKDKRNGGLFQETVRFDKVSA